MEEDIEKKPNTEEEFNKETEKMSIEEQHNEKGEGESKAGERKIKRLLASAFQVGSIISLHIMYCRGIYYGCGQWCGSGRIRIHLDPDPELLNEG